MLEFIANNPLLAPLPISVLVAGFFVLIVIFFWVAPIQKRLGHLQDKISKINSRSGLSSLQNEETNGQESPFAEIYNSEVKAEKPRQQIQQPSLAETGITNNLSAKSQSNIDLAKQGLERRRRRK